MRLKQYLTELFDEKRDFEIVERSSNRFKIKFEVGGDEYFADSILKGDNTGFPVGELAFTDQEGGLELTGLAKENAIEVYSYVISFIKYFIKEYEPDTMYIEPGSKKQRSLYKRLIKRYENEVEKMGYSIDYDDDQIFIEKK